jgi:hypothetical protein
MKSSVGRGANAGRLPMPARRTASRRSTALRSTGSPSKGEPRGGGGSFPQNLCDLLDRCEAPCGPRHVFEHTRAASAQGTKAGDLNDSSRGHALTL